MESGNVTICDRCGRRAPWKKTTRWAIFGDKCYCEMCVAPYDEPRMRVGIASDEHPTYDEYEGLEEEGES